MLRKPLSPSPPTFNTRPGCVCVYVYMCVYVYVLAVSLTCVCPRGRSPPSASPGSEGSCSSPQTSWCVPQPKPYAHTYTDATRHGSEPSHGVWWTLTCVRASVCVCRCVVCRCVVVWPCRCVMWCCCGVMTTAGRPGRAAGPHGEDGQGQAGLGHRVRRGVLVRVCTRMSTSVVSLWSDLGGGVCHEPAISHSASPLRPLELNHGGPPLYVRVCVPSPPPAGAWTHRPSASASSRAAQRFVRPDHTHAHA